MEEPVQDEDEFEGMRHLMPDGAVPEHGIMAVAFFDSDGQQRLSYTPVGDANADQTIGLMEMVKYLILTDRHEAGDFDDEEDEG